MASPASEPDAASSPRPVGIHHSDILFSNDQQMSMSALMSGLKRTTLTMHNRLRSIRTDAEFVARAASAFGGPREAEDAAPCNTRRPLIANERCGSWYVRPENKGGSAYFKSTDGHERAWKFSTRRLNLHIVELAEKHDGVIIVDSTRRGKRMPDALSTTIPVWCAVLNRVLLPQHPMSQKLFLPPSLPPTTHAQITALLPGFVASLEALTLPLPRGLSKPLRPLWITQDSVLPGEADGEDKGSSSSSVIFEDYRPVICCTASRRVVGSEMEEGGYIQGAGDDTENWAHGLTPPVFWAHVDRLLETAEANLPALIKQLVEEDAAAHAAATGSEAHTQLTPGICVCPTSAATYPRGEESSECHIQLLPSTSPQESWVKGPRLMQVGLGNSKAGSRNLRLALPHICAFAREYMRGGGGGNNEKIIVVSCDSGKDFSVGTALALSCLLLDDAGSPREEGGGGGGGGGARVGGFTKTLVKSRLGGFMTAFPAANPSRATLQSVNSFLMDWRN
ncbi:tRNA a64-2'-o-ribosylphosphate transferase [Beauveria brongniartii RCEF 3172]|uniref:tRNA a64-2'-o-ribosylphosphate transferase n=1 Tax=Beauveria brongniartii RCEF 3172 TaxID=1081107 RepID=A0A167E9X2_9HYPO|nr:tRNA a64-2'-o-ribosylphosphate transferase [Beauveria brongniartii RCEF 3172]